MPTNSAEQSHATGDEASAGADASKTPLYAQLLLEQLGWLGWWVAS